MKHVWQSYLSPLLKGIVLSYSSILFSQSLWFGVVLMLVTLLCPIIGLYGLASCVIANLGACALLKDKAKVSSGIFGFNAVFTGLAFGLFCPSRIEIFFAVTILVLLLTIWMEGESERLHVPFFVFPFLVCLWTLFLVQQQGGDLIAFNIEFEASQSLFGDFLDDENWAFVPDVFASFFKSLGLIIFQSNIFGGLLLAVALLCFSRIAFLYSFMGFSFGYLLYATVGWESYGVPFSYYGFNFILTSIAVGCYYVLPSKKSIAWTLALVPIQFFVVLASMRFFSFFFLPAFSFPFCAVSALFVYVLGREKSKLAPDLAGYYKGASPEETLYVYERNRRGVPLSCGMNVGLPFMGRWTVSQGVEGEHTHKGLWRYAWDFIVQDERGTQYKGSGCMLTDYYCFRKPVVATASGLVVAIMDDVEDNCLGEVDNVHNWGNYVVLKHAEGLYSAVCHLEKGSLTSKVGDWVEKGDILALCGNSGYSPFPHLHFQFQTSPIMGSPTLDFCLSSFVSNEGEVVPYGRPKLGDSVSNLLPDEELLACYTFPIGKEIQLTSDRYGQERWTVSMDAFGGTFFETAKAKAWFLQDGTRFRFLRYEGDKQCALYHFYLSNYHVPFLKDGVLSDLLSLTEMKRGVLKFFQDLVSPFFVFIRIPYEVRVKESMVQSSCHLSLFSKGRDAVRYDTMIKRQQISAIDVKEGNKTWKILFLS